MSKVSDSEVLSGYESVARAQWDRRLSWFRVGGAKAGRFGWGNAELAEPWFGGGLQAAWTRVVGGGIANIGAVRQAPPKSGVRLLRHDAARDGTDLQKRSSCRRILRGRQLVPVVQRARQRLGF